MAHRPKVALKARRELVKAAEIFLASLPQQPGAIERLYGYSQRELAVSPLDDPVRKDWSYWPRTRAGLRLGQMSAAQKILVHDMLAAVLSAKGHLKIAHIMQLEEILRSMETTSFSRAQEDYSVLLFGRPALDALWGLRFEGHHISINVGMLPNGEMSVTPVFAGAAPYIVQAGPSAGLKVLRAEEALARELLASFSPAQRAKAVGTAPAPGEVIGSQFEKPKDRWNDWIQQVEAGGIGHADLRPAQKRMLRDLMVEILSVYRPEIEQAYLAEIDFAKLTFLWLGSEEPGKPHYYRLQAEDFVFEYDNNQGNATHVHTLWRDKSDDFGSDSLIDHYKSQH